MKLFDKDVMWCNSDKSPTMTPTDKKRDNEQNSGDEGKQSIDENVEITPETYKSLFDTSDEISSFSWGSSNESDPFPSPNTIRHKTAIKRKLRKKIVNDYKLREMILKTVKEEILKDDQLKKESMKNINENLKDEDNSRVSFKNWPVEDIEGQQFPRHCSAISIRTSEAGGFFPWQPVDQAISQRLDRTRGLENDTFTLMMLSTRYGFAWIFLFALFLVQLFLLIGILYELVLVRTSEGVFRTLGVPMTNDLFVSLGQLAAIVFALFSQRDLLEGLAVFLALFKLSNWQQLNDLGDGRRVRWSDTLFWFEKIFFSYMMKLSVSLLTLFTAMVLILQSSTLIDLLKDFTALFIVASLDNFVYASIGDGYFGHLFDKELKRKERIVINAETRFTFCLCKKIPIQSFFFGLLLSGMITCWGYVAVSQRLGLYFYAEYPDCDVFETNPELQFHYFEDTNCDPKLYTKGCGMDGGDCNDYCMTKWISPPLILWYDIQQRMKEEKSDDCPLRDNFFVLNAYGEIEEVGFSPKEGVKFDYKDLYSEFSKCFTNETIYNEVNRDNSTDLGLFCFFGDFLQEFSGRDSVEIEDNGSRPSVAGALRVRDPFFHHRFLN